MRVTFTDWGYLLITVGDAILGVDGAVETIFCGLPLTMSQ